VLDLLRDAPRGADRRFRQDGHMLTCAPTGAGKGIGAVIPNLLDYPGSAFVLDLKGENYAVTARARRTRGQTVVLVDPFNITGTAAHGLNWLDTLNPDDADVVSRAAGIADMLVVTEGADSESHWNDTARELLRGLLIYVAGFPGDRRTMAELRRIVARHAVGRDQTPCPLFRSWQPLDGKVAIRHPAHRR
jgi:type IV secretion system protein VirD4